MIAGMGTLESAWDDGADFRLARYSGSWEASDVGAAVERDPTAAKLPCRCIVDQRRARISGSAGEVQSMADSVRRSIPVLDDTYVWLVASGEQAGIMALYMSRLDPRRRHRWFTDLDDALGHIGVSREVWDRTEAALVKRV